MTGNKLQLDFNYKIFLGVPIIVAHMFFTTSKIRHHTSHWVWGYFLYGYVSVYAKTTFDVCCQKALFWSHLTI